MLNYVLKYENTKISAQNIVRLETKSQYWCTDNSFFYKSQFHVWYHYRQPHAFPEWHMIIVFVF